MNNTDCVGFLVDRMALQQFPSEYFGFPLPVIVPQHPKCATGPTSQHDITTIVLSWGFTSDLSLGCTRRHTDGHIQLPIGCQTIPDCHNEVVSTPASYSASPVLDSQPKVLPSRQVFLVLFSYYIQFWYRILKQATVTSFHAIPNSTLSFQSTLCNLSSWWSIVKQINKNSVLRSICLDSGSRFAPGHASLLRARIPLF